MTKILIGDEEVGFIAVIERFGQFEGDDVKETGDSLAVVEMRVENYIIKPSSSKAILLSIQTVLRRRKQSVKM